MLVLFYPDTIALRAALKDDMTYRAIVGAFEKKSKTLSSKKTPLAHLVH